MGAMLNGQPRRTVRSRRSSSVIAQAIAILAKYGGSLWVADPAYTFTGSDGTGAAGDGSDAGYVRDLCGNARPLTQATTSFKPKLRRVPKRLGPELVTNGDFASATGWTVSPSWSISSGVLSAASPAAYSSTFQAGRPVQTGRQYRLGLNCSAFTSGSFRLRVLQNGVNTFSVTLTAAGYYTLDYIAPEDGTVDVYIQAMNVGTLVASFDDCTFREVIEWGWAWVGDGTDDTLVSAVQPTTNTAETMGVAFWNTGVNSKANAQHFINRRNAGAHAGQAIFQSSGSSSVSFVAGMGSASTTNTTQPALQAGVVASIQSDGTVSRRFANGEQKGTDYPGAYSFATSAPIYLLSSQGSANSFCDRPVFAAYYAPTMLPAAERLIVERAMAQLAGVTI